MIASLLLLASAAQAASAYVIDIDAKLREGAANISAQHPGNSEIIITGAEAGHLSLTLRASATGPRDLVSDAQGQGELAKITCSDPKFRGMIDRQGVTVKWVYSAPNWATPISAAINSAICNGTANAVAATTSPAAVHAATPAPVAPPAHVAKSNFLSAISFRGAQLGMTLDEFKALPPLSAARLFDNGLTSCGPAYNKVDAQLGVITCSRAGDNPFESHTDRVDLTAPEYNFALAPDSALRLYSIVIRSKMTNADKALSGIASRWGAGTNHRFNATNGFGQPVTVTHTMWTRSGGMIELIAPCNEVDLICVLYTHTALSKLQEKKQTAITGGSSNRF